MIIPKSDCYHPAIYGNAITACEVVVTRTAGASAVQCQPLEKVSHACGRGGSGDIAGGGAGGLNGCAARLGGNSEGVVGQNRLDVVHNASSQASGQGSAIAQGEHDRLASLEAVSSPRHNAGIGNADGNQGLGRAISAALYTESIRTAVVFNGLAELGLTRIQMQRDEGVGHGAAVAGTLRLQHPVAADQLELVDGLLGTQLANVEQALDFNPVDPLEILGGYFQLGLHRIFGDENLGVRHGVDHFVH